MLSNLPAIFSTFNGISFLCIMTAYLAIKSGKEETHKKFMITALAASAIFLALYLVYHFLNEEPTRYQGTGFLRTLYFTILISHTVLAVAILPFIIKAVVHAFKKELEKHKKVAKPLLPVWAYVSITGVVIYVMLYQLQ